MKEISRTQVIASNLMSDAMDSQFKNNVLQASNGTGSLFILDDISKSPFLNETNFQDSFKLCDELKYGCVLTTIASISFLEPKYKEIPIIIDLNPVLMLHDQVISTSYDISTLQIAQNKGFTINGVNINISQSDLLNDQKLASYFTTILKAHELGFFTIIRFNYTKVLFSDILRIQFLLGSDFVVVDSTLQFDFEGDNFTTLPFAIVISDDGLLQSKDLFSNLDLFTSKGARGVQLASTYQPKEYEDAKKLVESCKLILYEEKDSEDAYDYLIS